MRRLTTRAGAVAILTLAALGDASAASREKPIKVKNVSVKGKIDGENIAFTLEFDVEAKRPEEGKKRVEVALVTGDVVVREVTEPADGYKLRYDAATGTYYISWKRRGNYHVNVVFACRPRVLEGGPWREALFTIPTSNARSLQLECDRPDLEVLFPGALRLEREDKEGVLTVTALLGPGKPFAVRWKPEVRKLEAKLVMAADVNAIARASAGALGIGTLFVFDISQGSTTELTFSVPGSLSVTQVRGAYIRDWRIVEVKDDKTEGGEAGVGLQTLTVSLTRELTSKYAIEITAERVLGEFPVEIDLPLVEPQGVIRASGHLAVGTDSAIRLVVKEPRGLSQVDASGFRRIVLDREHPRPLPRSNAFFYTFAASPYQMKLALDDIVPSYDASERIKISVREEDLVIDAEIDLDVRDAPVRTLTIAVDKSFVVANVTGSGVDDYTVKDAAEGSLTQDVDVHFRQPVVGRTVVKLRLELGEGPLGKQRRIAGLSVRDAKNERGWVVIVADKGVKIEKATPEELRAVHTGSVPMRVPDARLAYRFREGGWALGLLAEEKPPEVGTEAFHMISLGEGIVYGSVVVTYYISGAPMDELHFRVPKELKNVEFISGDFRRSSSDGDRWTVRLQRKVIGYYHLLITYSQHYEPGDTILVGAVECDGVDTQRGFIAVASRVNLKLTPRGPVDPSLLDIGRDEVPPEYRLLVNAPILKTYKYVSIPHRVSLELTPYDRGELIAAVGDMMEIETDIFVDKEGEAQSKTSVTYRVKNSNRQFLSLAMPAEVKGAWSVHQIGADGLPRRVAASRNKEGDRLLVPIERRLNPNDPITLELEYAQVHEDLGVSGRLALEAPRGDLPCTFARWTVRVPNDWTVQADEGGNMLPEAEASQARKALAALGSRVAKSWEWALGRLVHSAGGVLLLLVAIVALVLVLIFRRRALPTVALGMLVAAAVLGGLAATRSRYFPRSGNTASGLHEVSFSQVLNLSDRAALNVAIRALPSWRRQATFLGAVLVPIIGLGCLAGAVFVKNGRRILVALGLTGAVSAMAQFPVLWPFLGHIFTWGLPALFAAYLLIRFLVRLARRAGAVPVAATLLVVFLSSMGCARPDDPVPDPRFVVDRIEYDLKAEKDTMEIALRVNLKVDPKETELPLSIPLVPTAAILVSPEEISRHVKVERVGNFYCLRIEKRSPDTVELKFLSPLPAPGKDGLRSFALPMPPSLTNRVELTIPEARQEVEAPTAVELVKEDDGSSTVARAIFGPGDECVFIWRPRERQTKLEKTAFFTELTSLVRFDSGLAECRHRLRLQIAQGELRLIRVRIPEGTTVTAVEGSDLGTWRFDPASCELEARLSRPVSGEYQLGVMAQTSCESLPGTVDIGSPEVLDAEHQRGIVGLATSAGVFIDVTEHPVPMNVEDFVRDAAALIASARDVSPADIRQAYRYLRTDEKLKVLVSEVRPELRGWENASFDVKDDRLRYNGELAVGIAKAGVFSLFLEIPEGYDIDSLSGPAVSHWDEEAEEGARVVQVHLRKKLLGKVVLKLTLSQAIAEMPEKIDAPRVRLRGAAKHSGQITVSSTQGVRISVESRKGVSEVSPAEHQIRRQGVLVFKLLRPDWSLDLRAEVVETRREVEFLHVARVSEGLVRNTSYLRHRLHNAGAKVFEVQVPEGASGVDITGSEIATLKETPKDSGLWRVERARKWTSLKQAYMLTVRYETRFDRSVGRAELPSARAVGVDLQRGHIVVHSTEKVELMRPEELGPALRSADARSVPRLFGAGDQSGAAFCFAASAAEHGLVLAARRHEAASLLEAKVQKFTLTTIVTELGESINRVDMTLIVAGQRYLETLLPEGAEIWSLLVDRASVVPSTMIGEDGAEVLLVPLRRTSSGEMRVDVSLVYVATAPEGWRSKEQNYVGPKFGLPLNDMSWILYLPEGFEYDDFHGTLTVNDETVRRKKVERYGSTDYEEEQKAQLFNDNRMAKDFLTQGNQQADEGFQDMAKQSLENALNLSLGDVGLNDDVRVQLYTLNRQQAVVGLVGRRGNLRPRVGAGQLKPAAVLSLGDKFSRAQAERLESSLGKADSDNLQLIADRMILEQEKAAGFVSPLRVDLTPRGRMVRFERSLQVEPDADMAVHLTAKRARRRESRAHVWWGAGLFVALLCAFLLVPLVGSRWDAVRGAFAAAPPRDPDDAVDPNERKDEGEASSDPDEDA